MLFLLSSYHDHGAIFNIKYNAFENRLFSIIVYVTTRTLSLFYSVKVNLLKDNKWFDLLYITFKKWVPIPINN